MPTQDLQTHKTGHAAKAAAVSPAGGVLAERLALARERGLAHMQHVLRGDDMLSLAAAARLGPSAGTLSRWRRQRRILALKRPAAVRGYRYPRWQFEPPVLASIGDVLKALPTWSDWKI
jgi:hypothetical protein